MRMLDKIKKLGPKVKCGIGWHNGTYAHIAGEPQCFFAKTCPDCGKYITEKRHKYGEWFYPYQDRCEQVRECVYCQDKKTRTEHQFAQWEYYEFGKCNQIRECIRCHKKETRVEHDYQEHHKDSQCRIIKVCTRCKDEQLGSIEHNWVKIPFSNNDLKVSGKRKCRDCGYIG